MLPAGTGLDHYLMMLDPQNNEGKWLPKMTARDAADGEKVKYRHPPVRRGSA